ncbi:cytidylate kinase-like family protein [Caproicibacter fermentans]|uniref:cytidylate kinase-like family protein n=1 Tax=Caproicibacter fermentans TaxID=2576756 RepID=UPI002AA5BD83
MIYFNAPFSFYCKTVLAKKIRLAARRKQRRRKGKSPGKEIPEKRFTGVKMGNYVITIARGYGSGGKQIGIQLAKELGIWLIDKELLQMASVQSGINEELFHLADEKLRMNIFRLLQARQHIGNVLSPEHRLFVSDVNLFNYQAKILRRLAESESFVVIGRAADDILKDYPNVLSVGIRAPFEDCVGSIENRAHLDRRAAEKDVKTTDRYRAEYYKFYTGKDWNDPVNYDLCLNSSRIGRDKCAAVIRSCLLEKLGVGK